jgi:hypothetical protein
MLHFLNFLFAINYFRSIHINIKTASYYITDIIHNSSVLDTLSEKISTTKKIYISNNTKRVQRTWIVICRLTYQNVCGYDKPFIKIW